MEMTGNANQVLLIECMHKAFELYNSPANIIKKKINFRIGDKTIAMVADEIYTVETAINKSHKIIITEQTRRTLLSCSLSEIEDSLDESFFKCSKSCIVNLNHITQIDHAKRLVRLDNGNICKVSTRKMKHLVMLYDKCMKIL